jgi:U5 small nuclear ribonucleoprotein component
MDELYDEFGNYIGPDLESDEEEEIYRAELPGPSRDEEDEEEVEAMEEEEEQEEVASNAVVLHEDKKYYPTPEELYGPGVEV